MATVSMNSVKSKEGALALGHAKRAFTDKEAGLYIGMSRSWLRHIRLEGARLDHLEGPRFIKMGRSVRYLREDLDFWLERFQRWDHLAQHHTESH